MAAQGIIREPLPFRIDAWSGEDGLPQSSVTTIAQTRDGYLWLGTFGGLTRFDGSKFKVFNTDNTPKLPSSRVLSLFEDRKGALWIGTEDGLVTRYLSGNLAVYSPPNNGTVSRFIKTFGEADHLWMVSAEGQLFQFADDQFHLASTNWPLQGKVAQTIAVDHAGKLWVGTEKELALLRDGQFISRWGQNREAGFGVEGLAAAREDGLWVAGNGRIRLFKNDKWAADLGSYPWSKGVLSEMHEDSRGQLWLGVYGAGLFVFQTNGTVLTLSRTEGLPGNLVRSVFEDFEGNIWTGTEGHGLARVKPTVFRSYGRDQGLSSDVILTVCEGQEGELWIGTNGEGINRMKNGVIAHYGANEGPTNECVWSVCQDRNKTLWAGTWGGGLFKLEGDRFVQFVGEQCGPVVCGLFPDSKGSLWLEQIRNTPELAVLRGNSYERVNLPLQLPRVDSRAVTEDAAGNLWVGTRGDGLYRIAGGKQTRFGKKEGLSSEYVMSLYADAEGVLWVGTRNGLHRLQDGKFSVFTAQQGLANDLVLFISEDNQRNLWCGSGSGIFSVNKDDLNKVACGQGAAFPSHCYTRADGLPSLEFSSACQPAGCKTRDGRLWFPTVNGLAVVDPENVPFNPRKPPVLIDEVRIETEKKKERFIVPGSEQMGGLEEESRALRRTLLRVAPGKSRLEFHYTALSLTAPEKVRFKYKLEPLENDWVEAQNERSAHYSYVRPGNYTFHVSASNNDGVWNEQGASLAVIILPHFWQTWWFRAAASTALLLLLIAAYEARLALERRVTRLRLRMARDLHDEIGSNLGTMALLSEVLGKETHGEEVSELRRVAVQTIDSLRDIVWFLDPAGDNMQEVVLRMKETARTMLRSAAFEFVYRGEADAPKPSLDLRRNLFPMFKEILHNIIRHAHATRVEIELTITEKELRLRIKDNGCGFCETEALSGNGLKNLRRRAADLNGSFELHSVPGIGTMVIVRAPIP